MTAPDETLCLFHARVDDSDGPYQIELPESEVELGGVEPGQLYRVAILPPSSQRSPSEDEGQKERSGGVPPVAEGDTIEVKIEDIGDQGDGIARVNEGYVVIVSDAELGERVSAEITEARANVAFADVVERHNRIR